MDKNGWSLKDYLRIGFNGFPKGGLCGIDVTYRCNLKCAHCYFRAQGYEDELSLRFFKSNVVFTNGTQSLPQWHDCKFVISVPGTKRFYQEITGAGGLTYERVKENANGSDLNAIVSYCITRSNIHAIDEFIDEWRRDTSIKGIFFEFYTPVKGHEDNLWVDWKERNIILDKLLSKKLPCTLGPDADCTRCGCMLPVFACILSHKRYLVTSFAEGALGKFKEHLFNRHHSNKKEVRYENTTHPA